MEHTDDDVDNFKVSFKYLKGKSPKPDLSSVIDLNTINSEKIKSVDDVKPSSYLPHVAGLLPVKEWKIFTIKSLPGFYFIRNPMEPWFQRYWAYRCMKEYPCRPHVCNLDAHLTRSANSNIWDDSQRARAKNSKDKTLLDKLRWVTLGYHHNWTTKHYSREEHAPFPTDLGYLSRYVIETLRLSEHYRPEAAIVNYYHPDSTLAGHTDHSEFCLEAPLVSFSFGQTAIFMVGGKTRAQEPEAMYLRSGDITVMSGPSRLAYHAVPRMMDGQWWDDGAMDGDRQILPVRSEKGSEIQSGCDSEAQQRDASSEPSRKFLKTTDDTEVPRRDLVGLPSILPEDEQDFVESASLINRHTQNAVIDLDFEPFMNYLKSLRINMNVRQVFAPGQTFDDVEEAGS